METMSEQVLIENGFKSKHGWIDGACHYRKGNVEVRCVDWGTFWLVTTGNQIYQVVRQIKTKRLLLNLVKRNDLITLENYKKFKK